MRKPASVVVLVAALFLGSIVACTDEKEAATSEQETAAPAITGPQVKVSADKTHAVQPGDEITLTVTVANFTLDASKIGQVNETNVGHYRVYLDDASGDNYLADSADPTVKVTVPANITDGSHQVRVVLHNNDHSPLTPSVETDVWLIVYRL